MIAMRMTPGVAAMMLGMLVPLSGTAAPVPARLEGEVDRLGDPLPPGAVARAGTLRLTLPWGIDVGAVALTPDGKRVLAAGYHDVFLWEVESGRQMGRVKSGQASFYRFALSPDGKTLAAAGSDERRDWKVEVVEVATGKQLYSFNRGKESWVSTLAFGADGKHLLIGGSEPALEYRELEKGNEVWRFDYPRSSKNRVFTLSSAAFSSDGKYLATADSEGIRLWDVATGKKVHQARRRDARRVSFSADGKRLVVFGGEKTNWAEVLEAPRCNYLGQVGRGYGQLAGVALAPDGKTAAWWDGGTSFTVSEVETGNPVRLFADHFDRVAQVAYSSDGKRLASITSGRMVRVWDVATGKETTPLARHRGEVFSVAFSPDGKTLATGGGDREVRLWESRTGKPLATLTGHKGPVNAVAFTPDGKKLLSGTDDADEPTVRLWDIATGRDAGRFESTKHGVWSMAVSPDGKTLATATAGGDVSLWDVASGERKEVPGRVAARAYNLGFSPENKLRTAIRVKDEKNEYRVRLWDFLAEKDPGQQAPLHFSTTWPLDGKRIASVGQDGKARVWDVATGILLLNVEGHEAEVNAIAFSPDGKWLATGGRDGTALVWDVKRLLESK